MKSLKKDPREWILIECLECSKVFWAVLSAEAVTPNFCHECD
jgi:hypothetical protein